MTEKTRGRLSVSTATITTAEQLWRNHPHGRCELVRGELRRMSPAGGEHGWVIVNITAPLATFVRSHGLGCVFGAETGFIIRRHPDSVRAPDIAFVCHDRMPEPLPPGFFDGPPDLAVEVLSPSDSASSVREKTEDWLTAGCHEVWLIDPRKKVASQCTWSGDSVVCRLVARLTSDQLPGFDLPVDEVFQR